MRISQVSVKNFRSLKDVTVHIEPYTCIVGPNGSGKSAIIKALNLFFYHNPEGPASSAKITAEDYHQKNTADPIRVELIFDDLSEAAKEDLGHYVRDDKLHVLTKVTFEESTGLGVPKQHGMRPGIEDFRAFFVAERNRKSVGDLRLIFDEIRQEHPDVESVRTKISMIDALRDYERDRPELRTLMESEEQFYGFTRGQN